MPACVASSLPCSVKSTSTHPVKRLLAFHSDWPCLNNTSRCCERDCALRGRCRVSSRAARSMVFRSSASVLWQCVALAMQCKNRLGLNFELRSARTSNYECWTADCGPKWPRRLCVCRCAPSWCGTSRYDATELKSFDRPLVELVTYPLSAPKVLVASKILLLSKAGAGELS